MALIACKECGNQVSTKARACPGCGAKVPHTKWWLWGPLGVVVSVIVFGEVAGNSPEGRAKAQARGAIDLCWKEQERKSLTPDTERFVASTCEMMERNFETKYGVRP